jgi:hypothetical protein
MIRVDIKYSKDPVSCCEYLVIKITQKERELKIDGRMFEQSPAVECLRRVIQEKHVARAFKYNPHPSLTKSELDRIQKLYEFSQAHKVSKITYLFNYLLMLKVGTTSLDQIWSMVAVEICMETGMD